MVKMSSTFACALLLSFSILLNTSCEESIDLPEVSAEDSSSLTAEDEPPCEGLACEFDVEIVVSTCFSGGTSLEAVTDSSEEYGFLWAIDGGHGGHARNVTCVCGDEATVRVTRLADGLSIFKTTKISDCEIDLNG